MNPVRNAINPIVATLGGIFGPIAVYFVLSKIFYSADAYGEIPMADYATCGVDVIVEHRRRGGAAGNHTSSYLGDKPYGMRTSMQKFAPPSTAGETRTRTLRR